MIKKVAAVKMSISATGTSNEFGFTLLELLIVIVLLGLLSAVGAQIIPSKTDYLEKSANLAEHKLRKARLNAMKTGNTHFIACQDLIRKNISASMTNAPDISLSYSCMLADEPSDGVFFYADGSASGEVIKLTVKDATLRITIDWLTGAIRRE